MLEKAQKKAMERAQVESRAKAIPVPSSSLAGSSTATRPSTSTSASTANGSGTSPDISPMDLTLVLNIPTSIPVDSLRQNIESHYGPLAHYILKDPQAGSEVNGEGKKKKAKGRKAIVEFAKGNWGGCWACWKDHQVMSTQGASLGEGVKAKWARGEEPAWVAWATSQSIATLTNGQNVNSTSIGNGNNPPQTNGNGYGNGESHMLNIPSTFTSQPPSSMAFDSAPDFGTTTMADLLANHSRQKMGKEEQKRKEDEFESMTLLRMRQMERERLEAQIRAEEGD